MHKISAGKFYGLQRIGTKNGGISILALDHRQNLKKAINPEHPDLVKDAELSQFKVAVTKALSPCVSAVLLDPEVGIFQAIAEQSINKSSGLIVALEETGYTGDPHARESKLLPGWSAKRAKLVGADAVKLLVYYHPKSAHARSIEDLVANVAEQCNQWDILFVLEPLTYPIDPQEKKLTGDYRQEVILETAQRLTTFGVDILKAEFPIDISTYPDESLWTEPCKDLTNAIDIPWILLSASVNYDTYIKQVQTACQAGAAGIAAGRAVWQEAVNKNPKDRNEFLNHTARQRMEKLTSIVDASAQPYSNFYKMELGATGSDCSKRRCGANHFMLCRLGYSSI